MQKKKYSKVLIGVLVVLAIVAKIALRIGAFQAYSGLAGSILFPSYAPLPVTGSYPVLSETYTWVDAERPETYETTGANREVTIKIWYPQEEGNYPLVVFSHGAGGVLESNASTCEELASNGYVAVAIAHPYQAAYVENTSGKVTIVSTEFMNQVLANNGSSDPQHEKEVFEWSREWMKIRTGDANFVLDTILAKVRSGEKAPFDRINPDKIGVFGHSLGGATAVALGRERTDISAVIDIEGTMLTEETGYENGAYLYREEPYPVPLLDINSRVVYERAAEQTRQYVNFYVGEHASCFQAVIFEDAGHMNFCDLALASPMLAKILGIGTVDARTCLENLNEIVLEYFNYYLKDAPSLDIREVY